MTNKPTSQILGYECWDCVEDKIDFVNPGKKEQKKIFNEKVKDSFKKIIQIILAIIGILIIISIFVLHNTYKETPIDKSQKTLKSVQEIIDYINESF
jgi:hypothetical protein